MAAPVRLPLPGGCSCGKAHWYPRNHCPFCSSVDLEWRESEGAGTIYSYSVMRRAKPVYVLAYVTLDEGPKMLTNIVGRDPESVRIGERVSVVFTEKTESGQVVPMFT